MIYPIELSDKILSYPTSENSIMLNDLSFPMSDNSNHLTLLSFPMCIPHQCLSFPTPLLSFPTPLLSFLTPLLNIRLEMASMIQIFRIGGEK